MPTVENPLRPSPGSHSANAIRTRLLRSRNLRGRLTGLGAAQVVYSSGGLTVTAGENPTTAVNAAVANYTSIVQGLINGGGITSQQQAPNYVNEIASVVGTVLSELGASSLSSQLIPGAQATIQALFNKLPNTPLQTGTDVPAGLPLSPSVPASAIAAAQALAAPAAATTSQAIAAPAAGTTSQATSDFFAVPGTTSDAAAAPTPTGVTLFGYTFTDTEVIIGAVVAVGLLWMMFGKKGR